MNYIEHWLINSSILKFEISYEKRVLQGSELCPISMYINDIEKPVTSKPFKFAYDTEM